MKPCVVKRVAFFVSLPQYISNLVFIVFCFPSHSVKRGSVFFVIFEARKFFSLAYYLLEPSRCETCRLLCYICGV